MFDDLRNSDDVQGSFTPDDELDLDVESLLKKKESKPALVQHGLCTGYHAADDHRLHPTALLVLHFAYFAPRHVARSGSFVFKRSSFGFS